jgi:hypothetical protein
VHRTLRITRIACESGRYGESPANLWKCLNLEQERTLCEARPNIRSESSKFDRILHANFTPNQFDSVQYERMPNTLTQYASSAMDNTLGAFADKLPLRTFGGSLLID